MAKLNESEERIMQEISAWRAQAPGFLSKATELASRPFVWAADKFVPADIKNRMADLTEKAAEKLQDASQWTVDEEDVLKAVREYSLSADSIPELRKASIHDLDTVSASFVKSNSQIAAAEGFGTGLIGFPGLVADIPALLTLSFRLINQVSLCYGFPVTEKENDLTEQEGFEISYMLRVLRVSTAATLEEKVQALMEMKDFESGFDSENSGKGTSNLVMQHLSKAAVVQLSKVLLAQVVKQTVSRKALAALPGIGAILSAGFNYSYIQDVGNSARMLYRERFLVAKKGRNRIFDIKID